MNFPNSVCISINDEVVHCLPSQRQLQDGDIISLDLGAQYEGLNSDTACTYVVGKSTPIIQNFLTTGYKALLAGIQQAIPGNHVNNISSAVEKVIKGGGYGVVQNFVGHGIGRRVHEGPPIPNLTQAHSGPLLVENMVICIEPILTMDRTGQTKTVKEWSVKTTHGSHACHFEHMVWITKTGPKVLTKRIDELI